MSTLTLNKITSQQGIIGRRSRQRVADLGWTPSYVQEAMTFPTDYKITKAPRDPMKQVLRSYFPMQEEKDNRVYGALDAALRGDMFRNVEPRWVEWMKLFLAIIPFPEISAARSMAMVGAARARRGTAHRLHHADGRRVPPLHDPDEPEEVVHGELYRPGRVRYHRSSVRQVLRDHDRSPVRRRLHHRRRDDRRLHVSDGRGRDGVHQHAVRRDAVGSRAQRRLRAADGVPVGAVGREPPHRQRPLAADGGDQGSREPPAARARPPLRLLAEPRDRRRRDRHLHRIRHHQPRQEQGILRGDVAPLDLRGLLPHLHAAAREIRHQDPPRRRRTRPGTASPRRTTSTRSRSSSRSAGRSTSGASRPRRDKDFEWFEHKYPGWYAEFGDFWKWYDKLSKPGEKVLLFNATSATSTRIAAGAAWCPA